MPPGNAGQQGQGPIAKGYVLRINAAPDAQENARGLGPRLSAGEFIPETLIDEGSRFVRTALVAR
jgi:hypothetical protein